MPRRRKTSLLDLAAKLPWKLSLTLAPISYLVLHTFAQRKPPTATRLDQMGEVVGGSMLSTLSGIGQYLVPMILLAGAAISYLQARKRSQRFELTAQFGQRSALLNMTWQDFEGLVAEHFKRKGFAVTVRCGRRRGCRTAQGPGAIAGAMQTMARHLGGRRSGAPAVWRDGGQRRGQRLRRHVRGLHA